MEARALGWPLCVKESSAVEGRGQRRDAGSSVSQVEGLVEVHVCSIPACLPGGVASPTPLSRVMEKAGVGTSRIGVSW